MPAYIKEWPNRVPAEFCQHLIDRFEADKRVQQDPQPDYTTRSFLVISGLPQWRQECKRLNGIINENTKKFFQLPKKYREITQPHWSHDGFLIARYQPGDTCILHVDGQCTEVPQNQLRIATFLLYLNTLDKGGETVFPLQKKKTKPEAGKVVMFPPMHSHPHEVVASNQPRYILQTWITDPSFYLLDPDDYKRFAKKQNGKYS